MEVTQLLKGVLDAAVLAVVQRDDGYGYDVVRRLRDAGLDEVGDASVYGTLRRLYAAGALSTYVVPSDDGPHRKYYSITPSGIELLEQQRQDWSHFSGILAELIFDKDRGRAATGDASVPETSNSAVDGIAADPQSSGTEALPAVKGIDA